MKTQLSTNRTVRHILTIRCNESGGYRPDKKDRIILSGIKNQSSIIADLRFYSLILS